MGIVLLEHLISSAQNRLRNRETQRLRGLEIDGELEGGRTFDRQVAGLGALQDPINVARGAPEHRVDVGAIGHEAAILHVILELVDRGQAIFGGQLDQLPVMDVEVRRGEYLDGPDALALGRAEGVLVLSRPGDLEAANGEAEAARRGLRRLQKARGAFDPLEERNTGQLGKSLLQQLKLLGAQLLELRCRAGQGSARTREALDESGGAWIDEDEDNDGNRGR